VTSALRRSSPAIRRASSAQHGDQRAVQFGKRRMARWVRRPSRPPISHRRVEQGSPVKGRGHLTLFHPRLPSFSMRSWGDSRTRRDAGVSGSNVTCQGIEAGGGARTSREVPTSPDLPHLVDLVIARDSAWPIRWLLARRAESP
jgi:hypothetical protein